VSDFFQISAVIVPSQQSSLQIHPLFKVFQWQGEERVARSARDTHYFGIFI
jgi:hypothetical protein